MLVEVQSFLREGTQQGSGLMEQAWGDCLGMDHRLRQGWDLALNPSDSWGAKGPWESLANFVG